MLQKIKMTKILFSVWTSDDLYECGDLTNTYYGPAVTTSYEEDGCIYVTNGEYCSRVNFCPFTGRKAENQIEGDFGA